MKKRSVWLVIGLLLAALLAFAGCRNDGTTTYELSETEISLTVGQTKELTIAPVPEGSVAWESGDTEIATVVNGVVTAIKAGSTTVTAKIEGVETALGCAVTVTQAVTKGYTLDVTSVALKAGENKQITVLDKDGNAVQSAAFESVNTAVATVSQSGLITAVAKGETQVKATVDGEVLVCAVTVSARYTYSLDKTALDIAAGASERITLISTPENTESTRPHTFSSSDEAVATVDGGTGRVTGVGKGTATITCLVDGEELTATVKVTEYTVKIGTEVMAAETTLRAGVEADITVTADPVREISAAYASEDETVVTVTNGHIVPLKEGATSITVTVGGRVFRTAVTVQPATIYEINHEEAALDLGETLQLEVTREPAGAFEATYESSDESIATVNSEGLVTATGVGTATITTRVTGTEITFETDVTVKFGVEQSEVEYADGVNYSVNLDALHETNVTLDWRYYGKEGYSDKKNGGALIGEHTGTPKADFYDYRVKMNWSDGTTTKKSFNDRTDGRTFENVSFTVKVTKDVKYIAIFTGAWHATNTVSISYNGVVCASVKFENNGGNDRVNKNKQIIFTPDVEHLIGDEMEFTITLAVGAESSNQWHDNISLVAVAVVGNAERQSASADKVTNATKTEILSGAQAFDLSAIGTEDWVYSKNGNSGSSVRKAGVSNVILENEIEYSANPGGNDRYANGTFKWLAVDATAAPAGATVNNFLWVNETYTIPVHLTEGKHVVTLYLSGWNCAYLVKVMDGNDNTILDDYLLTEHTGSENHAFEVKIPLNVLTEDTFLFTMSKGAGSPGGGNHGWAAVAVSKETEYSVEHSVYNVTLGATAVSKISVLKNGEATTDAVSYESQNTAIATVGADGTITAVAAGTAYVTVTVGGVKFYATVNVTEYTLGSSDDVTLSIEETSQITIVADPVTDIVATYVSADEEIATVSATGLITAVAQGETTITVTVAGKVFTVNVTVEAYKLSALEIVLETGETEVLSVLNSNDEGVSGVTFVSADNTVVTVDTTGNIVAVAAGKTTVTATVNGVELTCTVIVKIPATTDVIDYADGGDYTVNLTALDDTNATLDWRYYGDSVTERMKNNGGLIGDLSDNRTAAFYDYRAKINWTDGTTLETSLFNRIGGSTFKSVSFDVKLTDKVSYIAIFTGAWHATNTIEVKLHGKSVATYSFINHGDNDNVDKNKQVRIYPDVTKMAGEQTLTVTLTASAEPDHGWADNVSLVAVAVVGKEARIQTTAAGTATVAATQITGDKGSNKVNLTEVGTLDWIYSHYENPKEPIYRKFDGSVFTGETYYNNKGVAGDPGREWDGYSAFNWTDGIRSDLIGKEGAAAGNNPVDNDVPGGGNYTNNYNTAKGEIYIKMELATGKYQITAYLNSYRAAMSVALVDGNHNVLATQSVCEQSNDGTGWVVTFTLDVTTAGEFKLIIGKHRSHNEDRQVGWQAVAVAALPAQQE